jgi:C1A family cysteine protease
MRRLVKVKGSPKGYGWKRDLPDHRDFRYTLAPVKVPASVDLRPKCPPVQDQGQLGSCTANAIAGHLDFNRKKQGEAFMTPSRLFIYYNERQDDGTVKEDAGSSIRESVKAVANYGAVRERYWKYDISKFANKPTDPLYKQAIKYEALTYLSVPRTVSVIQNCLAAGYPLVIGFTVYESFENIGSDGMMPMPAASEAVLGGHAVMVVGYKQINGHLHYICRNSWGRSWGDKGYFYMPFEYLLNPDYADDFWTLRTVK